MADSNSESSKDVPDPHDAGITGTQNNTQVSLSIPDNYSSGGISPSPILQGYQHFIAHSPENLGSLPTFMLGIHQESVQEKMRLEAKLQEYETKNSTQLEVISSLKEKIAVLKTTLSAESRLKLMRSASITCGMMVLAFGFKLIETDATFKVGIGLILVGVALAAFGWLSRIAKESE